MAAARRAWSPGTVLGLPGQPGDQAPVGDRLGAGALLLLQGLVQQEVRRDHAQAAVMLQPRRLAVQLGGVEFQAVQDRTRRRRRSLTPCRLSRKSGVSTKAPVFWATT